MSQSEKSQSKAEQAKGKIKETFGKVTGNERYKAEGKTEQFKGSAREGKEDLKDTARGAMGGLGSDDQQDDDSGRKQGD